MGYGVIALPPNVLCPNVRVEKFGFFGTEKENKKANVLATEDNLRRAREIAAFLSELLDSLDDHRNRLVAICAESMSWPRNAGASAKMGISWGVVAAVAHARRVPILQTSPQAMKKKITGRRDANKDEVREGVLDFLVKANGVRGAEFLPIGRERSERRLLEHEAKIPKTRREHAWDALGLALACRDADSIQMARRAA